MYRNRSAYTAAAIIVFILVLAVVTWQGARNRTFASERTSLVVDTPEKAVYAWRNMKVRGRTLLLFDHYPHLRGRIDYKGVPQLTPEDFVEIALFENIVRRIFLVVPEAQWKEFEKQRLINPIRRVPGVEKGLYLFTVSGLPLIAITPSSLYTLSEDVLVYVNAGVFDPERARELLSQKNISSDIFITYRSGGL